MTGPFTFQAHRRTPKRGDQDPEGIPEVYDHMSCLSYSILKRGFPWKRALCHARW
jgi:hypothetical protein